MCAHNVHIAHNVKYNIHPIWGQSYITKILKHLRKASPVVEEGSVQVFYAPFGASSHSTEQLLRYYRVLTTKYCTAVHKAYFSYHIHVITDY